MKTIQELAETEDLDGLLAVAEAGSYPDAEALVEAIYSILAIWHYDFVCGKFPNIRHSAYYAALLTIESLQSVRPFYELASYFLMVADEVSESESNDALIWVDKAQQEISTGLLEDSADEHLYLLEVECLDKKLQLLGPGKQPVLHKRIYSFCQYSAEKFPLSDIWSVWLNKILREPLSADLWLQYRATAEQLYRQGRLSALHLLESLMSMLSHMETSPTDYQDEIYHWLALGCDETADLSGSEHQYNAIGHLYQRGAELFQEEWIYMQALEIFERCTKQYPQSWCPVVYWCNTRQALIGMYEADWHDELLEYADIYQVYIQALQRMPDDYTLHVHACRFLYKYISLERDKDNRSRLNQQRLHWAKAAEQIGAGGYWEPYRFYMDSYIYMQDYNKTEEWLLRGFLALHSLSKGKLQELSYISAFQDVFTLRRVMQQIRQYFLEPKQRVWRGGMDSDRLRTMSLNELRDTFRMIIADSTEVWPE